jgi:hypothetical protein
MSALLQHSFHPATRFVHNHDIMNCTAEGVLGNHLYSARALGISEPWDLVQLHPDLEPLWDDIHAHYRRIGLSHSESPVWHTARDSLGENIGYHPSVFYFGPEEFRFWGDDRWLETAEFINSKNNFMALADELGVQTPRTRCYDAVESLDPDVIPTADFPCYLKAAVSVSGVGIYRCEDREQLAEAAGRFAPGTPVQLQEAVRASAFLNLQYQVIGDELLRLEASEQLLDGYVHQGNRVPARFQPWRSVDPMAVWLKQNGLKGVFAFDVAVVETEHGISFQAIECNPRFNGASYPTLIANKLGVEEWTATTFSTTHRSLRTIDLRDLEFDRQTGEGVVIVNWGTVLVGRLLFLMAGSEERQASMQLELQARLC